MNYGLKAHILSYSHGYIDMKENIRTSLRKPGTILAVIFRLKLASIIRGIFTFGILGVVYWINTSFTEIIYYDRTDYSFTQAINKSKEIVSKNRKQIWILAAMIYGVGYLINGTFYKIFGTCIAQIVLSVCISALEFYLFNIGIISIYEDYED
jgi:predicted membrane protein